MPAHAGSRRAKPASHEDSLAREASLVAAARSALGRGDPRSALHAIRAARALPSKQLAPEELAVEEQALRALGQSDEANGIDVQLRLQYPESALAR
jgi:TolA-binding protein